MKIDEPTDFELAKLFFTRLKERGFELEIHDQDIVLNSSEGEWATFDFKGGKFYRIMGFTKGYWQDEIDWRKY